MLSILDVLLGGSVHPLFEDVNFSLVLVCLHVLPGLLAGFLHTIKLLSTIKNLVHLSFGVGAVGRGKGYLLRHVKKSSFWK